jgi:hypothetical protein
VAAGPADALREQAREWGRSLLAAPPWSDVSDRVSLLIVDPPIGLGDAIPTAGYSFWLTLDAEAARSLPVEYRTALTADRTIVEHPRVQAGQPRVTLAVMTDESVHRLLQGVTRSALEARWLVRHAEGVSDRLRRGEQYELRAGLLPDEAPERIIRGLWLEAVSAVRGLDALSASGSDGLASAGEATAALCRLACFDGTGGYPPVAYLRAVSRETRLGRRIATWVDDLAKAVAGDEAAVRRILASRDQVIEEARTFLGERYRDRPWLRDPDAFVLRPAR